METAGLVIVRATLHVCIGTDVRRGVAVDDPLVKIRVYLADLIVPCVDEKGVVDLDGKPGRRDLRWPPAGTVVVLINPSKEPGKEGLKATCWCSAAKYDSVVNQAGPKI